MPSLSVGFYDSLVKTFVQGILPIFRPTSQSAQQYREEVRRDQAPSEKSADLSIRMLYEFYSTQTTKNPGSIDATYLLDGVPRTPEEPNAKGHQQNGEDMHMQSSPYMSSPFPHQEDQVEAVPCRSVTLAKEEDLEGEMGMQSMGRVSLPPLECPLLKVYSGKGELQANQFHTYPQLGAE